MSTLYNTHYTISYDYFCRRKKNCPFLVLKLISKSILYKTRGGVRHIIRFARIMILSGEIFKIFAKVKQAKNIENIRVLAYKPSIKKHLSENFNDFFGFLTGVFYLLFHRFFYKAFITSFIRPKSAFFFNCRFVFFFGYVAA